MLINGLSLTIDIVFHMWYNLPIKSLILRPFLPSYVFIFEWPPNLPPQYIIDILLIIISILILSIILYGLCRLFTLNRFWTLCLTVLFGMACYFRCCRTITMFFINLIQPNMDPQGKWTAACALTVVMLGIWIVIYALSELIGNARSWIKITRVIVLSFLPWGIAISASEWFQGTNYSDFMAFIQIVTFIVYLGLVSLGTCICIAKGISFDCVENRISWKSVAGINIICAGLMLLFWIY